MEKSPESGESHQNIWNRPLKFARYLNEKQIQALQKGLNWYTLGDVFRHFPFRYEDRGKILEIKNLHLGLDYAQIKGEIQKLEIAGHDKSRRLVGQFSDSTGSIELVWFQKIDTLRKILKLHQPYLLYGKLNHFNGRSSFTHPELEVFQPNAKRSGFEPVYSTTETLKRLGLDSKGLQRIIQWNLTAFFSEISEPFPEKVLRELDVLPIGFALKELHSPSDRKTLNQAANRLKLEELFPLQFYLLRKKWLNKESGEGFYMPKLLSFTQFYESVLPFQLTDAQKRVLREIRTDMVSGRQMNRLVQGDVGSGKTVVALMAMLIAHDNGFQSCLMAPTEILANQHFQSIQSLADSIGFRIALLTGSTRSKERKRIAEELENGQLNGLVGTHALIEERVRFQRLGLSVIDEQHRFGVAQRARLHGKNPDDLPPHILVMTATPIPRTLAMALYSDLDISRIDELPAGRKEIQTLHRTESRRMPVFGFIREQIQQGRQAYFVYPMIEESENMDLTNLMEGYESITRAFPEYPVSIVHGKMKPSDKDYEMNRFVRGETKIMVATTVIEVGVNVPNASIMVIENAERFGLTQMHQLRGRVGRGEFQSYCILMTGPKLSREGKVRIETLCNTSNGFEIAETDLKLRGPGDIMGTQQSGIVDLKLTNLSEDGEILEKIKRLAEEFIQTDPNLQNPENKALRAHLAESFRHKSYWTNIS